jgi:hypothetical protein
MINKSIVWFIVLVFLNLIITPDFTFADSGGVGGKNESTYVIIGGVVIIALIIGVGLLTTNAGKKKEAPKDQAYNDKIESGIHLDYQSSNQMSYETNYDNQRINPSGQLVLHMC